MSARQAGNQILIEVVDDGRGIDGDALVRKAIGAGILAADRAERMSPMQKMALVFAPGLSTAGEVTAISGRGVGMDVVRANIERIGGVVDIDSRRGEGVRLCIRVPLTLTIIPALTVSAGGQIFAIPRSAIEEILRAGAGTHIATVGERLWRRSAAGACRCSTFPACSASIRVAAPDDRKIILLKPAGGDVFALAVDEVHDHEELVVKPAAPAVMAAASTPDDAGRRRPADPAARSVGHGQPGRLPHRRRMRPNAAPRPSRPRRQPRDDPAAVPHPRRRPARRCRCR